MILYANFESPLFVHYWGFLILTLKFLCIHVYLSYRTYTKYLRPHFRTKFIYEDA